MKIAAHYGKVTMGGKLASFKEKRRPEVQDAVYLDCKLA